MEICICVPNLIESDNSGLRYGDNAILNSGLLGLGLGLEAKFSGLGLDLGLEASGLGLGLGL